MDFDSGSDVIVLEDLFEYSLGDQIGGITGEQALMVVDVVAPLHAKYWGKAEETFPKMQRIDSDDFIKRSVASFYISIYIEISWTRAPQTSFFIIKK